MTECAFVALGSNLEDPVRQLGRAFEALAELPDTRLVSESPMYRNQAVGPEPQPAYVNAVAKIDTGLNPHALLDALQKTEISLGRAPNRARWAPRIIDLDLLIYDDLEIRDERLTVPHPEICRRRFVLLPLSDIAPDLIVPGCGPVDDLLSRAPRHDMQRIPPKGRSLAAG